MARALLGTVLARGGEAGPRFGRIVETEAYHGYDDRASHASRGQTPRNEPMFGEAGHAYVYRIYGVWDCLNAVTGTAGFPSAVLIRAVAPLSPADFGARDGAGPGKLCRLFGITRALDRADLVTGSELWIEAGERVREDQIVAGPRVGVDYAGEWAAMPWRFWVAGDPSVSRPPPKRIRGA